MKNWLTSIVQIVIVLIGIGALIFLLWEPHLEGRNAQATIFEIYFKDTFLAYVYISSILFFIALYQAFKLLGYVKQNKFFSFDSVKTLSMIKNCSATLIVLIMGAEVYLVTTQHRQDDIAGGVVIGFLLILIFTAVAISAMKIERIQQKNRSNNSSVDAKF